MDRARQHGIPILRRISGGASVVVAPGCLLYNLVIHWTQLIFVCWM